MIIEIIGKFYDNQSLTIINREMAIGLSKLHDVYLTPLDQIDAEAKVSKSKIKKIKELEQKDLGEDIVPEIQIRHSYPPVWRWPVDEKTKVVFIQPWEWQKIPFEWQYKWEQFADALIVPSMWEADNILNSGLNPNKLFVVPNGYDPKIFNREPAAPVQGIDPDKFNYVYVGCPQWRKGLDILLNAWSKTFTSGDNARLIIKDTPQVYGGNNILNEIVKLQYNSSCAPILYLDDNLSHEELASIYKNSKCIVHPYRAEGFGMHIQEAVACGCVPLVSSNGPSDEFTPDVGIKFEMTTQNININAPEVFALKPGDATTMMSTHTSVQEPTIDSVSNAMRHLYMHHEKDQFFDKVNNFKLENSWENVIVKYNEVLTTVNANSKTNRNN